MMPHTKPLPLLALLALSVLSCGPPNAARVAEEMELDQAGGTIVYGGTTYSATWGDEVTHIGDIRQSVRANHEYAPIVTTEFVLTTGDFSNPDIVKMTKLRNGHMTWRSKQQPAGTCLVLHMVPASPYVQLKLSKLEEGDRVELVGHQETDSRIESPGGGYLALGNPAHIFVLVTDARKLGD